MNRQSLVRGPLAMFHDKYLSFGLHCFTGDIIILYIKPYISHDKNGHHIFVQI